MKIFIPCAGIGSRLEFLTKNISKSLISINDKPAISHIIDKFSKEHVFVIALGYRGDLLKQFLTLAYPDRKFEFVEIENYDKEGSGLGLTIKMCYDNLQEPFLFIPTDSLFDEDESFLINHPDHIFFSELLDEESQYRKIDVNAGKLVKITDKVSRGLIYTGICHIHSFEKFWLGIDSSSEYISSGESYLINKMLSFVEIKCHKINWSDIGNLKALGLVKAKINSSYNILDKEDEAIWFMGEYVIKYHENLSFISNRVQRFKGLDNYIPKLEGYTSNMYRYCFVDGNTLSETFDLKIMSDLLVYLEQFWVPKQVEQASFENRCLSFYKDKTLKRLNLYKNISQNDCEIINGLNVGSMDNLISRLDWKYLSQGKPYNFHGDLHFENILKTKESFCLLDWRQDFEGDLDVGDIYYDFAKLLHGMMVAHDLIKKNCYSFSHLDSNSVYFDLYIKNINLAAQELFFNFLLERGFDIQKIKILTALIFINIAPLHHEPYNHMLYYLGKLQLHTLLMEA